ncbi:hypothetical protein RFI_26186 [Reticulomyxa filosa]|uniref:Uncharacterized protein n=1 Tax=Reticulomyxa filosa TaxID=46433 RepID=X6MAZ7_RETFI|nr:hypothetical protein RFI_26186 [Reticulomyxa filosa]|eukprot:ETO11188.1 hypothetical protein RFI_26186 [Reticulomyxa filosa]
MQAFGVVEEDVSPFVSLLQYVIVATVRYVVQSPMSLSQCANVTNQVHAKESIAQYFGWNTYANIPTIACSSSSLDITYALHNLVAFQQVIQHSSDSAIFQILQQYLGVTSSEVESTTNKTDVTAELQWYNVSVLATTFDTPHYHSQLKDKIVENLNELTQLDVTNSNMISFSVTAGSATPKTYVTRKEEACGTQPPQLMSAQLLSSGNIVALTFDKDTNLGGVPSGNFDCALLVDSLTVSWLGDISSSPSTARPLCSWHSANTLLLLLGYGHSLILGTSSVQVLSSRIALQCNTLQTQANASLLHAVG